MIDFISKNIWLILFIIWGLPLTHYRSKFRKIVYQTDNWRINIKPVFWKELKGLFTNLYPENKKYKKYIPVNTFASISSNGPQATIPR